MKTFVAFFALALVVSFLVAHFVYHDTSCMIVRCVKVKH